MAVSLEAWGDYALFSRPEFKVERVSYDVMTPSAARGLLESIFWHPGLKWKIDKIYVLNPIRFGNIRRNEVTEKISRNNAKTMMMSGKSSRIYASEKIAQRASMVLRDVHYVVDAHFELTEKELSERDSASKFYNMFIRRAAKGQCFQQPYLGCKEFPANFCLWDSDEVPQGFEEGSRDLGYMLYDMDYSDPKNIKPVFFRAQLNKGILDVKSAEVKS